jgi:hypothetical protein
MFEKTIEFESHEDYVYLKQDYPKPIKLNVPDWYKKLKHSFLNPTIKGCMPFLDTLTSGYLLSTPQDLYIEHNIKDVNGDFGTWLHAALKGFTETNYKEFINLNCFKPELHPPIQLEGCPYVEKNKNLPFHKIMNPWIIKTPPGYSCLFLPPLNNTDDRFSIIPGIVNTDTFKSHINFPIVINGDKYKELSTMIEKGTPYVQVIPFKRDNWKMKISKAKVKKMKWDDFWYNLTSFNSYKNKIWNKVKWN